MRRDASRSAIRGRDGCICIDAALQRERCVAARHTPAAIVARPSPTSSGEPCMKIRLAAVFGLLLAACQPAAETAPAAEAAPVIEPRAPIVDAAHIDTVLQAIVEEGRAVGVSALVHEGGREVYFGAFGMADREAGRPMARDTLAQVYSMTKPVTGVVLMSLYEEGLFDLDAPLSTYLPE